MNKQDLKKFIKKHLATDVSFSVEVIDKKVYFSLYGFDNREVCFIEIPYKNQSDKKAIYTTIADLIQNFDFSFRVVFSDTKSIYQFIQVTQ